MKTKKYIMSVFSFVSFVLPHLCCAQAEVCVPQSEVLNELQKMQDERNQLERNLIRLQTHVQKSENEQFEQLVGQENKIRLLKIDLQDTKEEREKLAEVLNKTLGNKELAHTPCYKEILKTAQETFEPETVEKKEAQEDVSASDEQKTSK